MKIGLNLYNNINNYNYSNKKALENNSEGGKNIDFKSFTYPAFTGGKSLSLQETKAQLDKFGSYPPDIKEAVEKTIAEGNPKDKTLIDVHLEKYKDLNQLDTLDEIKELYPEFEGVLSDNEIKYNEGSFIDDFKKGKVDYFDPDVDIAVQLIQMYWGDGFSLNDIKGEYTNNKNVYGVFQKLNIPCADRLYGHYLKFSDKKYNERFTQEMSEKFKNVQRTKIERKEGVYIPRGPQSEETKKKISESLVKYWTEHPERAQEMSDRQKKYFECHPEQKEIFTSVLLRAWRYKEADPIKKYLSKFLEGKEINNEELADVFNENSTIQNKLKEFWNQNSWAKEKFSKCMVKSWARQKELQKIGLRKEPVYIGEQLPPMLKKAIVEFNNGKLEDLENSVKLVFIENDEPYPDEFKQRSQEITKAINAYFDAHPDEDNKLCDIKFISFVLALDEIAELKKQSGNRHPAISPVCNIWNRMIYEDHMLKELEFKGEELDIIRVAMLQVAVKYNDEKVLRILEDSFVNAERLVNKYGAKECTKRMSKIIEKAKKANCLQ